MKKNKFLKELEHALASVSADEKKDILYDYEEHFRIGKEEGKTEEEVAEKLGSPFQIAQDVLGDSTVISFEQRKTPNSMTRKIITSLALILFNGIVVVGPLLGIVGIYLGIGASSLALTVAPIISFFMMVSSGFHNILFDTSFMIVTMCIGIFVSVGSWYLGKWLFRMIRKYIMFNAYIVKGGE